MTISYAGKRKILVLHGYAQNAYAISRRISRLMQDCDEDLEFYYLDGPHIVRPAQFSSREGNDLSLVPLHPQSEELACGLTRHPPPSSTPRGWWIIDYISKQFSSAGLEASLTLLRKVFKENRFEAVIGFSQGSAIAEYITSMLEGHHPHPVFCDNGRLVHPPLKYAILNSGFLLRGPYMDWTRETPQDFDLDYEETPILDTPILHVIGKNDVVVVPERTDLLTKFSRNKKVLEHYGGHFINTRPCWQRFFADFFRDPLSQFFPPPPASKHHEASPDMVFTPDTDSYVTHASVEFYTTSERESSAGSLTPDSASAPQTPVENAVLLPEYSDSNVVDTKLRKNISSMIYIDA